MNDPNDPIDGQRRKVIVTGGETVGRDAVIEFGDLDGPGRTYRAIVCPRQVSKGLAIGDQCVIRYRESHRFRASRMPATWIFVERTDNAFVDSDAEVVVMTAGVMP